MGGRRQRLSPSLSTREVDRDRHNDKFIATIANAGRLSTDLVSARLFEPIGGFHWTADKVIGPLPRRLDPGQQVIFEVTVGDLVEAGWRNPSSSRHALTLAARTGDGKDYWWDSHRGSFLFNPTSPTSHV